MGREPPTQLSELSAAVTALRLKLINARQNEGGNEPCIALRNLRKPGSRVADARRTVPRIEMPGDDALHDQDDRHFANF